MTDEDKPLWQIRSRVRMLEASIAAHDTTLREIGGVAKQNTERARKAHDRIDQIEDSTELLRKLVEQVESLTERVKRIAAFCQTLKEERRSNGKVDSNNTRATDTQPATRAASDATGEAAGVGTGSASGGDGE